MSTEPNNTLKKKGLAEPLQQGAKNTEAGYIMLKKGLLMAFT